ncbi:hypothetical protein ACFE04_020658 [Oxalis oulophora]
MLEFKVSFPSHFGFKFRTGAIVDHDFPAYALLGNKKSTQMFRFTVELKLFKVVEHYLLRAKGRGILRELHHEGKKGSPWLYIQEHQPPSSHKYSHLILRRKNKALTILGTHTIDTSVSLVTLKNEIHISAKDLNSKLSEISKVETSCSIATDARNINDAGNVLWNVHHGKVGFGRAFSLSVDMFTSNC